MLEIGTKAPSFTLPTDTGSFSLANQNGKKMVVFFFPRADTSGCTKEAIAFSELLDQFTAANCGVIGISKDTAAKQAKFRAKHGLTCLLGADDETDVCEQFGVWLEKSMYGKSYMGIQRATFVIDESGNIAAVWPKVKVPGHAEEVLACVEGL
jgi:peroxiredoxin Q/BCP